MAANRPDARSQLVTKVFKEYLDVTRAFWSTTERRAKAAMRDGEVAAKNSFALQRVLRDRQALRFGYLLDAGAMSDPALSLNDITVRLDTGWTDEEERLLISRNKIYAKIAEEERVVRSKWKAGSVDQLELRTLQDDPRYTKAREDLAFTVRELGERLRV